MDVFKIVDDNSNDDDDVFYNDYKLPVSNPTTYLISFDRTESEGEEMKQIHMEYCDRVTLKTPRPKRWVHKQGPGGCLGEYSHGGDERMEASLMGSTRIILNCKCH